MEQFRIVGWTTLFGKHYVWLRGPDGNLTLAPDPLRSR